MDLIIKEKNDKLKLTDFFRRFLWFWSF